MASIHDYDLFLFDFDGLLVNSEELHFTAYRRMFQKRGFELPWSFQEYIEVAHYSAEGLRVKAYELFPKLEENWDTLYKEKSRELLALIEEGRVELMPGVEALLLELQKWEKTRRGDAHKERANRKDEVENCSASDDSPLDHTRRLQRGKACTG